MRTWACDAADIDAARIKWDEEHVDIERGETERRVGFRDSASKARFGIWVLEGSGRVVDFPQRHCG